MTHARRPSTEQFEQRQLFDVDAWHNSAFDCDVDGDGAVYPRDALTIINDLNQFGARQLDGLAPNGIMQSTPMRMVFVVPSIC